MSSFEEYYQQSDKVRYASVRTLVLSVPHNRTVFQIKIPRESYVYASSQKEAASLLIRRAIEQHKVPATEKLIGLFMKDNANKIKDGIIRW